MRANRRISHKQILCGKSVGRNFKKHNIYTKSPDENTIYRVFGQKYHDEARHGKAFEGLLKRYFG